MQHILKGKKQHSTSKSYSQDPEDKRNYKPVQTDATVHLPHLTRTPALLRHPLVRLIRAGAVQARKHASTLLAPSGGLVCSKFPHPGQETNEKQAASPLLAIRIMSRVNLTCGNRSGLTDYRSNRFGPVPVSAGTQPVKIQNLNLNLKNEKFSKKIPKNTSSCNESNGIKFYQKFVHLV